MAEINKDEQIQVLPVLDLTPDSAFTPKYTITVTPDTKFYRITNVAMQAFGLLSLIAWFVLLISLLAISFSVLNNLESVQVIRTQNIASSSIENSLE